MGSPLCFFVIRAASDSISCRSAAKIGEFTSCEAKLNNTSIAVARTRCAQSLSRCVRAWIICFVLDKRKLEPLKRDFRLQYEMQELSISARQALLLLTCSNRARVPQSLTFPSEDEINRRIDSSRSLPS